MGDQPSSFVKPKGSSTVIPYSMDPVLWLAAPVELVECLPSRVSSSAPRRELHLAWREDSFTKFSLVIQVPKRLKITTRRILLAKVVVGGLWRRGCAVGSV